MEFGLMLDLSRGKVLNVKTVKKLIRIANEFGYTYLNLYLEDLISLDEYPQFGYMRGKYSDEEIKEIVEYGSELGVEIYPAIQTLSHLEHFLKWEDSNNLKETTMTLNVKEEQTLKFIDCLVKKCKTLFKSTKINIGMDEAFDLGTGKIFREDKNISQKELYLEYLEKVLKICKNNGFTKIKMWSDMFFSIYTNEGEDNLYGDISNIDLKQINGDVELIFWNYWTKSIEEYENTLIQHKKFTSNVSIALGIHTWGQLSYKEDMLEATKCGLIAAKNQSLNDILFTMWGDDGSLYNLDTAIYGMYITSCLMKGTPVNKNFFEDVTGIDFDVAAQFSTLDKIVENPIAILWNDPITNIYFNSLNKDEILSIQKNCEKQFINSNDSLAQLNNLLVNIFENETKLYLGENNCSELSLQYQALLKIYETLWIDEAKYYGIEEMQKRFITKIYRLKYLADNYTDEELQKIRNDRTYENYNLRLNYSSINSAIKTRW